MFVDDTTLYDADADLGLLLSKFSKKLEPLLDWCKFNKLDQRLVKDVLYIYYQPNSKNQSQNTIFQNIYPTVF